MRRSTAAPWHVLVVGAGLIGTSVGAALARAGHRVVMSDLSEETRARAQAVVDRSATSAPEGPATAAGAGSESAGFEAAGFEAAPDVVVIAVPPRATAEELIRASRRYVESTVMDTASVKAHLQAEIERLQPHLTNIILTHPVAGRASAGPDGALPTLFDGRTWALCRPSTATSEHAARAEAVARACGASPVWLTAAEHDATLAVTSHVPQLLASGLAATMTPLGDEAANLSGPALLEMTRVADSPVGLWAQIAAGNAGPIAAALGRLIGELEPVRTALASGERDRIERAVSELLATGRAGRALVAAKHGAPDERPRAAAARESSWTWVDVQVPDRQGGLAAVFAAAAESEVNVEDVRLDHAPHAPTGTVSLAVAPADAQRLRAALTVAAERQSAPAG